MNYNISETNYKNFIIGSGWPVYKNISIYEMADRLNTDTSENNMTNSENNMNNNEETDTTPRYDTAPGNSRITDSDFTDVTPREAKLMKELYSSLNKLLVGFVERVLDEFEYVNSPIYDEDGIDRETLAQFISRVLELANGELDETQEIILETIENNGNWSRHQLLTNLVQSLLLSEIFLVRRPRFRRARNNYRFSGGMYNGINPQ